MDCRQHSTTSGRSSESGAYRRREPEQTLLYQVVQGSLDAFLEQAEDLGGGRGLPEFVKRELRAYLRCGILAHGFARVHCSSCGKDDLVAFSCKGRGFCPSCGGRRMADCAAHLVDRVMPAVPVRQWVFTVPIRLRYLLAFDRNLFRRVRNIFVRAVLGWNRRAARRGGIPYGEPGAVTAVQRFGSALNLNVHFHSLVLDGVFHPNGDHTRLEFWPLPAPTEEELGLLLARITSRIRTLLHQNGLSPEDLQLDGPPLPSDSETLGACVAASLHGRVALGSENGRPIARRGDPSRSSPYEFPEDGCVRAQGFSLHAGVRIPPHDREALERLCRYLLRLPLSNDRLSLTDDGRIAVELKTRWSDGTTHFLYEPMVFLERLAALIPPPRAHLVVYHGVLAPCSALRSEVVTWKEPEQSSAQAVDSGDGTPHAARPGAEGTKRPSAQDPVRSRPRNYTWAELMKRVLERLTNCSWRRRGVQSLRRHAPVPSSVRTAVRTRPGVSQLARRPSALPRR